MLACYCANTSDKNCIKLINWKRLCLVKYLSINIPVLRFSIMVVIIGKSRIIVSKNLHSGWNRGVQQNKTPIKILQFEFGLRVFINSLLYLWYKIFLKGIFLPFLNFLCISYCFLLRNLPLACYIYCFLLSFRLL